jgi:hypothetical protein
MIIQDVTDILRITPSYWQRLASALPAELLWRRPAMSEWSALECLQHLVDAERFILPVRVRCFLAGENFPAFNPDRQGSVGKSRPEPVELAAEFHQLRIASVELLGTLTEADLPRRAVHGELGPVTLEQMLNEWPAHDLMHTVQAERAIMQPFIAECGPWQVYFKDHRVG